LSYLVTIPRFKWLRSYCWNI